MQTPAKVYYLAQTQDEVPKDDDWLTASERDRLTAFRFPKRRADWRLGRWTAKCAVAAFGEWNDPPAGRPESCRDVFATHDPRGETPRRGVSTVEIRAAGDGAPEVFCNGQPVPLAISISHCLNVGFCVVVTSGEENTVGCDVEQIATRSQAFVADFFTTREQQNLARLPAAQRELYTTLVWSAKESVLKVLRAGLRLDTRRVEVDWTAVETPAAWQQLTAYLDPNEQGSEYLTGETSHRGVSTFWGWWRCLGGLVQTVAAAQPTARPEELPLPVRV